MRNREMITGALIMMFGMAFAGIGTAAEFDFRKMPDRAVGSRPEAVAIGDVNGDGLEDVVLATTFYFDEINDYHVFVYLQKADGTLAQPTKFKYAEFSNSIDLSLGDLNNDGIKDIIAGSGGQLLLLIADGAGGFSPEAIATPTASSSMKVAVLDINNDGNLDVVGQYWYEGATLFFGDGNGSISSMTPLASSASGYNDLKVGDVTGDGRPDLVITSQQSTQFYVHSHNGIAGFWPEVGYANPGTYWQSSAVAIGDFDGDGGNDVAVSIPANQPEAAIWLYSGLGSAGLAQPARLTTYDIPEALIASDLDGDGRDDLLVGHGGWYAIGRYMQGAAGLGEERRTAAPFNSGNGSLALGDFNDDGCSDVAIADYNAGLVTLHGENCIRLPATSDFDGDGRSDLFWNFPSKGNSGFWRGADKTSGQRVTTVTNVAWQVVGTGDFDGDGKSDLLWRNGSTGAGAIWRSANSSTSQAMTRITNLDWNVVGIGDFNGDGSDDVLWRNRATGVNGIWKSGNFRDQQAIAGVANPHWKVVGVDDFNGDGKDDILWRNSSTGANVVWHSGNFGTQRVLSGVIDQDWQVAGTADFNSDGQADVLWRHRLLGWNVLWYSADFDDRVGVKRMIDANWKVAAIGDYDGNGKPEILWRNRATGENGIWRSTMLVVVRPVASASPGWQVIR